LNFTMIVKLTMYFDYNYSVALKIVLEYTHETAIPCQLQNAPEAVFSLVTLSGQLYSIKSAYAHNNNICCKLIHYSLLVLLQHFLEGFTNHYQYA